MIPVSARSAAALALAATLLLLGAASVHAGESPLGDQASPWPTTWNAYTKADGSVISDVNGDINPTGADIASGACSGSGCAGPEASVLYYADGTTAFFRLRVAEDISSDSKGGIFGNAFLVQLAVNGTVEAVVGVDGKDAARDYVYVTDSVGGTVREIYAYPFDNAGDDSRGMRIVPATDGDYYLDWQVPISHITAVSEGAIDSTSALQFYYGTSAAANLAVINKDFMLGTATTVDFSSLPVVSFQPAQIALASDAVLASGPATPTAGSTSTYTVSVQACNPGGSPLSNTKVSIPVRDAVKASGFAPGQGSVSTGSVIWDVGTLIPGQCVTLTFSASITPGTEDIDADIVLVDEQTVEGHDEPAAEQRTTSAPLLKVGPVAAAPAEPYATSSPSATPSVEPTTAPSASPSPSATSSVQASPSASATPAATTAAPTAPPAAAPPAVPVVPKVHVKFATGSGLLGDGLYDIGDLADALTPPARPGYTFVGWFTEPTGGTEWVFGTDVLSANITLYARWEPIAVETESAVLAETGLDVAGRLSAAALVALTGMALVARARRREGADV